MDPNDEQPIREPPEGVRRGGFCSVRPGTPQADRPSSSEPADSAKSAAADRRFSNEKSPEASSENSRPGRKPVLDEAKRSEICAIIATGGTRTMAARYVGCSLDTITRTADRDPAFADQIRKAEVGAELRLLRNLGDAKRWRSAAWALERFFPDRYGRRKPRTVTLSQLRVAMRELGARIMHSIDSVADRKRVLDRLDEMAGEARRLSGPRRRRRQRKIV